MPPDPLKYCRLYKEQGCSHVDGFLCNVDTCRERILHEISSLEQELDIPLHIRLYKCKPELFDQDLMNKQTQFKIIQLTHQRDELIHRLQDLAEDLNYEDVSDIVYDITKLNKTIKKLSNE